MKNLRDLGKVKVPEVWFELENSDNRRLNLNCFLSRMNMTDDRQREIQAVYREVINELLNKESVLRTIVVRWTGPLTPEDIYFFFITSPYTLAEPLKPIDIVGWYEDEEKFMALEVATEDIAEQLDMAYDQEFLFRNVPLKIYRLFGKDGVRINDSINLMKMAECRMNEDGMATLLWEMLRVHTPAAEDYTKKTVIIIKDILEKMVSGGKCFIFGSYASPERRQATSDIDLTLFPDRNPVDPRIVRRDKQRSISDLQAIHPLHLFEKPLTKLEMEELPKTDVLKIMFKALKSLPFINRLFNIHYTGQARTPLIVLSHKRNHTLKIDVSLMNFDGINKSALIHLFQSKDQSRGGQMRKCMIYFVYWGKCNELLNGVYPEEQFKPQCGFNSYIFNHLIMHFIQVYTKTQIIFQHENPDKRVKEYNFGKYFINYTDFIKDFFKYIASVDFSTTALLNGTEIPKTTAESHGIKSTPMVIVDPFDATHNISSRVTVEEMKHFNQLIRNALFILKQKNVLLSTLLETNENAAQLMAVRVRNMQAGVPDNVMTFELPDIIQTSKDFCILLHKILRFDVSAEHVGTSQANLFSSTGVTFVVFGKAWIGRRVKRRELQNLKSGANNLEIELAVSKSYEFSYDEAVAVVKITMTELPGFPRKTATLEVLQGNISEMRDAIHFLIDQFIVNNLQELTQTGIEGLAD